MKNSLWLSLVLLAVPIYAQNPIGTANRVIQGSGVPSSLACQDIGDVGKVYARNDGAAANTTFYTCGNTGVGTYAWELSGGGSGGGVISFNTRTGAVTLSSGDVTTALGFTPAPSPSVLASTSGPVTDPGGLAAYQFNNAAGALTFNVTAGVAGYQRCYRNSTGKSGAITIQMPASNTVDLNGANGSSAGTLLSTGALGDAVCLVSDIANHWYAYVSSGSWSTT